jgi:UDP-N-acetylglucosamine--N-acetylmuramyl-(pentapeptide) pyrophosphoryl-undecaprenol N-acetylglucosamine transferase
MKHYFFAGGGTGGHIYPAISVAECLVARQHDAQVRFLCSNRPVDSAILGLTDYDFTTLPAMGFSARPGKIVAFLRSMKESYCAAKLLLEAVKDDAAVIATGGFVSVPVVLAAAKLGIPVSLINVDIVPGKANKILARFADKIFVQFKETRKYFKRSGDKVVVTGCPLRAAFGGVDGPAILDHFEIALDKERFGLDPFKNVLLITGASSGATSINRAIVRILGSLDHVADQWRIVHLTGHANIKSVSAGYAYAKIQHTLLEYCDNMADLYACADIIVGRAGAVSIAEFAASGKPCICLPYPYHKDNHQYKNAQILVDASAAIIVEDIVGDTDATARELLRVLLELMADDNKRLAMGNAARAAAKTDAASCIVEYLREA